MFQKFKYIADCGGRHRNQGTEKDEAAVYQVQSQPGLHSKMLSQRNLNKFMYLYVCVYMCVCIYVCMYIYIYK
jgi:hypothetical protein